MGWRSKCIKGNQCICNTTLIVLISGCYQVGFTYNSVVEDFSTSLKLHCGGWKSVYLNPSRPQFLGTSPTNLNDVLIQNRRWNTGLLGIGISRFCPLIYGPSRMSFLQSVCYAQFAFLPLYCLPVCCFGIIPQLCLLGGISLYPEVNSVIYVVYIKNMLDKN